MTLAWVLLTALIVGLLWLALYAALVVGSDADDRSGYG